MSAATLFTLLSKQGLEKYYDDFLSVHAHLVHTLLFILGNLTTLCMRAVVIQNMRSRTNSCFFTHAFNSVALSIAARSTPSLFLICE